MIPSDRHGCGFPSSTDHRRASSSVLRDEHPSKSEADPTGEPIRSVSQIELASVGSFHLCHPVHKFRNGHWDRH